MLGLNMYLLFTLLVNIFIKCFSDDLFFVNCLNFEDNRCLTVLKRQALSYNFSRQKEPRCKIYISPDM